MINNTDITIPTNVVLIGWSTFSYCTNLTSITIPSEIKTIEESLFDRDSRLYFLRQTQFKGILYKIYQFFVN